MRCAPVTIHLRKAAAASPPRPERATAALKVVAAAQATGGLASVATPGRRIVELIQEFTVLVQRRAQAGELRDVLESLRSRILLEGADIVPGAVNRDLLARRRADTRQMLAHVDNLRAELHGDPPLAQTALTHALDALVVHYCCGVETALAAEGDARQVTASGAPSQTLS